METRPDFIVVGSGIAGIRAAIQLAPAGRVTVLTKARAAESNTEYAQGGVAVVLNDDDEITLHEQDTLAAGDGLCDPAAVQVLVREGPARIEELIAWGAAFDREGVRLAFTREAAHSRRRILHAGGDSTGQEINRTLFERLRELESVDLRPHCFVLDLIVERGRCVGVRYLEGASSPPREMRAGAVLLATGGLGRLYRETTNPEVATGDGFALAWRAGAALADMEFVQFHPTALQLEGAPHFLLSEALRGEGAHLVNAAGERFMTRYHPAAELAPRDVVSRSIFLEAQSRAEEAVFLDLRHLEAGFLRRRFPRIHGTCLQFGLDITRHRIPVFPAAHYMMGGVYTDLDGRTTVAGLFAAGEVACTGVHGANRLASNSLLEGLVFGRRASRAMADRSPSSHPDWELFQEIGREAQQAGEEVADASWIRRWMSERVGIVRCREGLAKAEARFRKRSRPAAVTREAAEAGNLLDNACLVAAAARRRTESRGGHYRSDFPERDDGAWLVHLLARRGREDGVVWGRTPRLQEFPRTRSG